jgi:hypothetical protein
MKIIPIETTGPDDRGYTAEYYHERLGLHQIIFRKAGTVSGGHYHKGISMTKNPEIFILMSGSCTLKWRNVNEKEEHTAIITAPTRLEIPPYTIHTVLADTDITCLELNGIAEHRADTFYPG